MKIKKYINIILSVIVLISFSINIYQGINLYNYRISLRKNSYNNIEAVRYTNEIILTTLQGCINSRKVTREELVLLNNSYNGLVEYENELKREYVKDEDNLFKNKISSNDNKQINNEQIFWNIEKLIGKYLIENSNELILKEKSLNDFLAMQLLAQDINDIYVDFYKKYCVGLDGEKKEKEMIKKDHWIAIFEKVQAVNKKYIEYPFIYEEKDI